MATSIVIPSLGLTMEEATIIEWIKGEGEFVEKNEPIVTIETDKATTEVEAPDSGLIGAIVAQPGDVIPVGQPIAILCTPEEYDALQRKPVEAEKPISESLVSPSNESSKRAPPSPDESGNASLTLRASPAARRTARELGVHVHNVSGTGPEGRILEHNVLQHYRQACEQCEPADTGVNGVSGTTVPLTRMRETIANRMLASGQTTAAVTLFAEIRMDEAVSLRNQMNESMKQRNAARITFDALIAKAAAMALQVHDHMQWQWSPQGLRRPEGIHIGFATALPDGLVVPVIRDAHAKSLFQMAAQIEQLAGLARSGKLAADQTGNGTFTISNLGMYPIGAFTPIINVPETAILGLGGIRESPVIDNGVVAVGKTAQLSLTFDHRVVDGAPAAAFLTAIKALLERPYQLFWQD